MSFEVVSAETDADVFPFWFPDQYSEGKTYEQQLHDFAYYLICEIRSPKKLETARKRLMAQSRFMAELGKHHPSIYDEVLTEYVERVLIQFD